MRTCFSCGNKTYVRKDGREQWYLNHDEEDNVLCNTCFMHLIHNPKWGPINNPRVHKKWGYIHNRRRLVFKNRVLVLKDNPRIDVCNLCRKVAPFDCKRTNMHHEKYDESNPLANTLEMCVSCHNKQRVQR